MNLNSFDNYRQILQVGGYLLLAALLSVTQKYLPYLMGLWVLGSVSFIPRVLKTNSWIKMLVLFPSFLFVSYFISLIYSHNIGEGGAFIEKWLSVPFITFAILSLTNKVKTNDYYFYRLFIVSNLLVAFFCLIIAFVNSLSLDATGSYTFEPARLESMREYSFRRLLLIRYSHFSYEYFSQIHHPTYFAMYISFVIGILFYFIRQVKRIKWIITYVLGILFFLVINCFLASRAGYVVAVLLIVFSFVWFFHRKVKRHYIIIASLMLLFGAGVLLMKSRLGRNMRQIVALVLEEQVPKEQLDERLLLWHVGMDLAREAPLWGYGVGDVHDKLDELYEERGMEKALAQHFNVHNQYLSVYLATGVFGLAALLYWFFGSLILGIRTGNYLLSVFMLIIIINALFENILDRSAGLAFILLFYPILMHQSLQKKRDET